MPVEGINGIHIMSAGDGPGGDEQDNNEQRAEGESDPAEGGGADEQHEAQELEGVAELVARLGEVRDGNERHVRQHLRHEPMRLHGEVAEHERTNHGKRVGKDAGGVERGELEEVDNELGQEELGEDGDLVLARDGEEAQRAVGKVGVLHEQIPHGRDEEREQKDDHAQNAEAFMFYNKYDIISVYEWKV